MINLPRQLIYQDRTKLSDYLAYNELNQAIYEAFKFIQPESWWERLFKPSVLSDEEILSMFNDAYYLCIVAANDPNFRKEDYTHPDGRHAFDVWQMVKVILSLQEDSWAYNRVLGVLGNSYLPLSDVLRRFKDKEQTFPMKLELHVPDVDTLEMDWEAATRGFKKRIILGILGLWTDPEDKLKICGQIRDAFLASPRRDMPHVEVDGRFFEKQMEPWKMVIENREWELSLKELGLWDWEHNCPVDDWIDRRWAMEDNHTAEDEPPQPEEKPEAASIEEDPAVMEEDPTVIEKEKKKKSIFVNSRGEENLARRAEETERFLKYIQSKIDTDKFVIDTSAKNFVNLAFVAFFREWSDRGWAVENGWVACYRFLHYDCGFRFSVQKKVYATFIGKMAGYEYDIEDELKIIIPEVKACFQSGASAES